MMISRRRVGAAEVYDDAVFVVYNRMSYYYDDYNKIAQVAA